MRSRINKREQRRNKIIVFAIKVILAIVLLGVPMVAYINIGAGYAPLGDYIGAFFKLACFGALLGWYAVVLHALFPELMNLMAHGFDDEE